MNLLLIILSLVIFSFIPIVFPKLYKICIFISVFVVLSVYFFLANNFYYPNISLPSKNLECYNMGYNYYNLLAYSLRNKQLYITKIEHDVDYRMDCLLPLETTVKDKNYEHKISATLLDTSCYKGKIYLYFGITPVLLFYLPFNLAIGLYLTDNFLCFILACFIFLLSLFLIKLLTVRFQVDYGILDKKKLPIHLLSVFLLGFCSLLPFILIRTSIYEVAISTAVFLLICSFITFYYYMESMGVKKNVLASILGILLSLCVGARPHYVLFIPLFFTAICVVDYCHTKNVKFVIKQAIIFLIPCLIVGTCIALYNYLRFDSIFEFGFKYQIKPSSSFIPETSFLNFFENLVTAAKQIFFKMPDIDIDTFFSLVNSYGHRWGNDYMVGILWICPIFLILLFIPNFLKQIYGKNKNLFVLMSVMICVIMMGIIITSFFGMHIRYIFEYFLLMLILSVGMFWFYICTAKDKLKKSFINAVFVLIFVWSMFIGTALLFCKNNFINGYETSSLVGSYRIKAIEFLFK